MASKCEWMARLTRRKSRRQNWRPVALEGIQGLLESIAVAGSIPNGSILIVGSVGSGKSTAGAAFVSAARAAGIELSFADEQGAGGAKGACAAQCVECLPAWAGLAAAQIVVAFPADHGNDRLSGTLRQQGFQAPVEAEPTRALGQGNRVIVMRAYRRNHVPSSIWLPQGGASPFDEFCIGEMIRRERMELESASLPAFPLEPRRSNSL